MPAIQAQFFSSQPPVSCRLVAPAAFSLLARSCRNAFAAASHTVMTRMPRIPCILTSLGIAIIAADPALAAGCRFEPQGEGRIAAIIDARTFRMEDGREV